MPIQHGADVVALSMEDEDDFYSAEEAEHRLTRRARFTLWAQTRLGRRVIGGVSVGLVLAAWQICADTNVVQSSISSSPWGVITAGRAFYSSSQSLSDLAASGIEILYGFLVSLVVGIALGVAIGTSKLLEAAFDPFINLLYSMPRIALAPLFVIWFGIGITSKIAVIFLSAVFPIILNTAAGLRSVDRDLVGMSRLFGANRWYVVTRIMLPSSVPSIVAGIRLAIGNALLGMVVAELIASTRGIGFLIESASNNFQTNLLFVGIFTIAVAALILMSAVRVVERKLDRWRP